jgi:hypothetical protein
MNPAEERVHPSALIPWIIALVALIACNALMPGPALARKIRDVDGSCLTQVSGEVPAAGAQSPSDVFLVSGDGGRAMPAPPSRLLGVDAHEPGFPARSGAGVARGRAPPAARHS